MTIISTKHLKIEIEFNFSQETNKNLLTELRKSK